MKGTKFVQFAKQFSVPIGRNNVSSGNSLHFSQFVEEVCFVDCIKCVCNPVVRSPTPLQHVLYSKRL